jgi:hypothetical protein
MIRRRKRRLRRTSDLVLPWMRGFPKIVAGAPKRRPMTDAPEKQMVFL